MSEPKTVVLGGNRFPFHRIERLGPALEQSLHDRGIEVEVTTDRDVLCEERIRGYDAVVDITTDSTLSERQETGLQSFVEDGGGYAGIHGAADLTTTADERLEEPIPELRELIGGHFLGHPEQSTFDVNVVDSHHPITADLDDFSVWDEPYMVEYDDDVQVLARMDHPENGDMPVAWVKPFGDGRVFYCSLGHDLPGLRNDGVQTLLERGIRWASRNE